MKKSLISLLKSRTYVCMLLISALSAYAYGVTHSAIGIDDTAIPLYFQQGLTAYWERWGLYLLIRILHIPADYGLTALVDGASVLILCCSATIWTATWKWLLDRYVILTPFHYGLIAALFVTNPIISEVFIFFLHNGSCMSYGLTGLALYFFLKSTGKPVGQMYKTLIPAVLLLSEAVACYESFLLTFVIGAILCFITIRIFSDADPVSEEGYPSGRVLPWIGCGIVTVVLVLIIYKVMFFVCKFLYSTSNFEGIEDTYRILFGKNLTAISELGMTLKRYLSMYHIAGMLYLPIGVLIGARIIILLTGLTAAIRRKDLLIFLATAVLYLLPPFMAVAEGNVTKYRTAQYVPMLSAFALLLLLALAKRATKDTKSLLAPILIVFQIALIIWQCLDMNKWFYVDYAKYEDAASAMSKVAEDLQAGEYDLSKPLVFVGAYRVPEHIAKQGMISFHSGRFRLICALTDPVDPHWKEKFYSAAPGLGYVYNSSSQDSILQWGTDAFNHTDEQMIRFLDMIGYPGFIAADTETMVAGNALQNELQLPSIYSGQKYIYEAEDFLLINIAAN